MKRRERTTVIEPPSLSAPIDRSAEVERLTGHLAEHARLLDAASDRIDAQFALLARITELHSHDNLTGCCLTCGRAGPCKTTRILTGESR